MSGEVMAQLPEELMKEIEYWAEREKVDKSTLLTKIMEEGLNVWKMNKALEMYRLQKVTLWKAAEIAGVSLAEMLAELPKRKIIFQYDLDELREDLEYARSK
ncbi:MAG TPA: UPF0175 family protein [Candidatus Atribacteria bacterium]|jgi:predicted HTH domain antitoxin|uniref:UPF0175 family protein n=1 Tax=Candidatus Sordicultor fermentans TaxID=1953203 RepID=UPI0016B8384A|nr:hypothetical protein [Candidatus Atribacteria bacterium]HOA99863.1 UPF0175 family protein [Candidatus Atribacteria bacterium]HOQ51909.1 UPF0175 family protein [Candidatus Atribacteria bacterium]HPT64171.1 UPF0175 family protein [Candidatus Atribacteria bacterium]HPZ40601.1 UPF0175 family protein [Candidatus Atribacteria bacterium]